MDPENETEDDVDILDDSTTSVEKEVVKPVDDDLREAVKALTRLEEERAKPKEEPAKPLSPEAEAELWALYDPEKEDPKFVQKFFRLPDDATDEDVLDARKRFASVQKGLVRQSVKAAINIMEAREAKFREELAPIQEYYKDAQAAKLRSEFSEEYPEFADAKYNKILELADKAVAGQSFKDRSAYFKAVAETAAGAVSVERPDFVLGAAKKPTKTTGLKALTPRMTPGSNGGAGAGGGREKVVDDLDGIFDV